MSPSQAMLGDLLIVHVKRLGFPKHQDPSPPCTLTVCPASPGSILHCPHGTWRTREQMQTGSSYCLLSHRQYGPLADSRVSCLPSISIVKLWQTDLLACKIK